MIDFARRTFKDLKKIEYRVQIETCPVPVSYGNWLAMPETVRNWATGLIQMCQPKDLHIMDGSDEEDVMVYMRLT